jgi:hypothetical protein
MGKKKALEAARAKKASKGSAAPAAAKSQSDAAGKDGNSKYEAVATAEPVAGDIELANTAASADADAVVTRRRKKDKKNEIIIINTRMLISSQRNNHLTACTSPFINFYCRISTK